MKVSIQEKHLETDVVQQSKSKGTSFVSVNQDNDSNMYRKFIYTHTHTCSLTFDGACGQFESNHLL